MLLYLIRLADILGVDLAVAATAKLAAAELRYPVGGDPGWSRLRPGRDRRL